MNIKQLGFKSRRAKLGLSAIWSADAASMVVMVTDEYECIKEWHMHPRVGNLPAKVCTQQLKQVRELCQAYLLPSLFEALENDLCRRCSNHYGIGQIYP